MSIVCISSIFFPWKKNQNLKFLADDTSLVIEKEWVFCYYCEEDHLIFKVASISHMATMKYIPFPRQWEEMDTIECDVV